MGQCPLPIRKPSEIIGFLGSSEPGKPRRGSRRASLPLLVRSCTAAGAHRVCFFASYDFFPCASSLPSFNPTLFPRGTSGGWEVLFSCVTESTKPVATVQSFPTYVLRHREAGWKHAGGPLLPR